MNTRAFVRPEYYEHLDEPESEPELPDGARYDEGLGGYCHSQRHWVSDVWPAADLRALSKHMDWRQRQASLPKVATLSGEQIDTILMALHIIPNDLDRDNLRAALQASATTKEN